MEPLTESQKALLYKVIGEKVTGFLKIRGDTQSKLAERLHKNKATISNILSGTRQPSLHFLIDIALELNIEPSNLLPNLEELKEIIQYDSKSATSLLNSKGVSEADQTKILKFINSKKERGNG